MERLRTRPIPAREETELPGLRVVEPDPQPAPTTERDYSVRVIHGASDIALDIAGQTIGQVRPVLDAILGIGRRAVVLVDGARVRDDFVLAAGSSIEVVKRAGEKGAGRHESAH